MTPRLDNNGRPTSEYVARLEAMSDEELTKEASDKVWLSAYAANNPRSDYHWHADACSDEAARREKPWLYQRGYNQAYRFAGFEPSEAEIEAARGPSEEAA